MNTGKYVFAQVISRVINMNFKNVQTDKKVIIKQGS